MGRFINSDALVSTGQGLLGNNMFAYCRNNPVSRVDSSGRADIGAVEESFDDDVEVGPNDKELGGGGGSSNGSNASSTSTPSVPQHAWDTLNHINSHDGNPPPGYRGGTPYANDGRNGTQRLPQDTGYREYDVHPYLPGINRGMERIVIGDNGIAWYTGDHYFHFVIMEVAL